MAAALGTRSGSTDGVRSEEAPMAGSCADGGGLPWSAMTPGERSAREGDGRWLGAEVKEEGVMAEEVDGTAVANGGGGGGGATVAWLPRPSPAAQRCHQSRALHRCVEGLAAMGRWIPTPRAMAVAARRWRKRPAAAVAHPWTSRAAEAPERPVGEPLRMGVERREGWREEERCAGAGCEGGAGGSGVSFSPLTYLEPIRCSKLPFLECPA
jgi:hypothetical protein